MVLQPFVLILVVNEVSEEFPIARCLMRSLNYKVVAVITEIWHTLHTNDSAFDVAQLFEAEGVWGNRNFRVTDFEHAFRPRTHQLNSLTVIGKSNISLGLLVDFILLVFLDLRKKGRVLRIGEKIWVFFLLLFIEVLKKAHGVIKFRQAALSFLSNLIFLYLLLVLAELMEVTLLNKLLASSHLALEAQHTLILLIRRAI